MKRIQIDFAQPSLLRSIRRTQATVWMPAGGVLALGVYAAFGYWQYLDRLQAYDVKAAAVQRSVVSAKPRTKPPHVAPVSEAQAIAINGIVLRLNLPWRTLFDSVQDTTPPGVALLALEPDARKQTIRITAEARGSDEMIAYIEQMQQQELFSAVSLIHHEINEQDRNRPIRFQVDAQWKGRQ